MKPAQTKAPRLYCNVPLAQNITVPLTDEQNHYLLNVMRRNSGDMVRVFNDHDGEWLASIIKTNKRTAILQCKTILQQQRTPLYRTHLFFAPLKKDRLSLLIEKSVELGATDLRPILTNRTENRNLNIDRLEKQIIEAAEQCERMDIPLLHDIALVMSLSEVSFPIIAAIERDDSIPFMPVRSIFENCGFLTGPEGGWTDEEITFLHQCPSIRPVSLGKNILRAETAALYMLARSATE